MGLFNFIGKILWDSNEGKALNKELTDDAATDWLTRWYQVVASSPYAKALDWLTQPIQNLTTLDEDIKKSLIQRDTQAKINQLNKQLAEDLKEQWITAEDVLKQQYGYELPDWKKKVLEEAAPKIDTSWLDKKRIQELLEDKADRDVLDLDQATVLVEKKWGKDIENLWLDKEKASELFWMLAKDLYANIGKDPTLQALADRYVRTLLYKIKEYDWDFQQVANDPDLLQLDTNISNALWESKYQKGTSAAAEAFAQGNVIKWVLRTVQAAGTKATEWVHYAAKWIRDLWNLLPWGQIETETLLQWKINRIWASTAARAIDAIGETVANALPDIATMIVWWQWVTAVTKWAWLTSKLGQRALMNQVVNSVANAHFDPELHWSTIATDLTFDILWEWLMGAFGKAARAYKKTKNLRLVEEAFWDSVIKIWDKEIKLTDILYDNKDLGTAAALAEEVGKWQLKSLENVLKGIDEMAKKLWNVDKRAVKKAVVELMADNVKKYWTNPAVWDLLQNMARSKAGVDEAYNAIVKSFDDFKNGLKQLSDAHTDKLNQLDLLLDTKKRFVDYLSQSVKKEGKKLKVQQAPLIKEWLDLKYEAKAWEVSDEAFNKALDGAMNYIQKKFKWQKLTAKQFVDEIENYFNALVWDVPAATKKQIRRMLNAFKNVAFKQDTIIELSTKKLPKNAKWLIEKGKIKLSTLKNLYKDPQEFFIVAFHELTHWLWEWAWEKIVWPKRAKWLKDYYRQIKKAVDDYIAATWDTQLAQKLWAVLQDEEEFIAYMLWEYIVKWDSQTLNGLIKLLEDNGIKDAWKMKNRIINALKTYLSSRFKWLDLTEFQNSIRQALYLSDEIQKWRALSKKLTSLLKNKQLAQVPDVLEQMSEAEFKDAAKNVFWQKLGKQYALLYQESPIIAKNVFYSQLLLNLPWEKWFKAAYYFSALWDLLDDFGKLSKEDLLKKLEQYKNIHIGLFGEDWAAVFDDLLQAVEKSSTPEGALTMFVKTLPQWKASNAVMEAMEKAVRAYNLWKRQIAFQLMLNARAKWAKTSVGRMVKWATDYFNKFVSYTKRLVEKWTKDLISLKSLWFDSKNWNETLKLLSQGSRVATLIKKWLLNIDIKSVEQARQAIAYLFDNFDTDIAYKLAKYIWDKFGLTDEVITRYKTIKQLTKKAENKWIELGKKTILWVKEKYWASLIKSVWNDIVVVWKDWRSYLIWTDWTIRSVSAKKVSRLLEESPWLRRDFRYKEIIDTIFEPKTYQEFININEAIKKC